MVSITGMGVQCAVAHGVQEFDEALRDGRSGITFEDPVPGLPKVLGLRGRLPRSPEKVLAERYAAGRFRGMDEALFRTLRTLVRRASRSIGFSLLAAVEAWGQARLGRVTDRRRIALVIAGSNLSQQLSFAMAEKYRKDPAYVSARYAHQFWDSDLLGVVSEGLDVRGEGMTVSGASAAGNVGLIQGMRLIRSGCADVCLVVAGMQELSDVELMAFANLGALGGEGANVDPARCNRPFDAGHDGFVYGEGAAALVLESTTVAQERGATTLAVLDDGVSALDGSHLTQPSQEGEEFVMGEVLRRCRVDTGKLDLISAHATSTPLGDETEAAAIRALLGERAGRPWVNATKSLVGHCLGPASAIEAIACVLQMRGGYVHPNVNLAEPITRELRLAPPRRTAAVIRRALNNAFGFGGINTALLLRSAQAAAHVPDIRKD